MWEKNTLSLNILNPFTQTTFDNILSKEGIAHGNRTSLFEGEDLNGGTSDNLKKTKEMFIYVFHYIYSYKNTRIVQKIADFVRSICWKTNGYHFKLSDEHISR